LRKKFNAIKRLSTPFNLEPSTRWQKVLKRTARTPGVNG
jgi:hypothetical protein